MAKVEFKGILGSDPRVLDTKNHKFTSISVAESRNYKDKKTGQWVERNPNWIDVAFFNQQQSKVSLLKKGDRVQVVGVFEAGKEVENDKYFNTYKITGLSIEKLSKVGSEEPKDSVPNFDSEQEIKF